MKFLQYSFIFCSHFRHNAQRKHFRNYLRKCFLCAKLQISIYSLFNLYCFNLFSLQSAFFQSFLFSLTVRNNKILTTSNTGKMTPAKIPIFRFSDAISETNPTKVGPPEHPASPASASSANNAVPPSSIKEAIGTLQNTSPLMIGIAAHISAITFQ